MGENGLMDALNGLGQRMQGAPIAGSGPSTEPAKVLVFRRAPQSD
jgi:hypothetical protein